MQTVLYKENRRYIEKKYEKEMEFENTIINNSKLLFGENTICINAKKKIDTQFLGGAIPDFFLFNFSDIDNPEFYIVEVELAKHSFFNHIFPQITKFFAFFKNQKSRNDLIDKIYSIIIGDEILKNEFLDRINKKELYLFLKETIEYNENILLIVDDEKKEIPEIIETYTDTWGKIVKICYVKEYTNKDESIFSISPDFENIEVADIISKIENEKQAEQETTVYNEEYHLNGVEEKIREIYKSLKNRLFENNSNLKFNSQRYYISMRKKRNFAYFKIRKNKIILIPMISIENAKEKVKTYQIKELSLSVQNFYNGDCCEIIIEKEEGIEEIEQLLKSIEK